MKDKKELIKTVKKEIEVVTEDCEYLAMLAKHSLVEFDDFESERTLNKLNLMLDEIRRLNRNVLNLITVTKMSCILVRKEKEIKDDKSTEIS